MALLILNVGSSSLRFSVIVPEDGRVLDHRVSEQRSDGVRAAVRRIASDVSALTEREGGIAAIEGVAHRVVHGGTRFTDPVLIAAEVRAALVELSRLAPLHNPPGLEGIDATFEVFPGVPQVAVFDTAFHSTLADDAFTYALPWHVNERWGLRRFGFHGLSHAYCAERAAEMLGRPVEGFNVLVAHLGNGASVTAVRSGRSVDTSMGFTPLEGLVMGTRSGSIDPGVLLHLQQECGFSAEDLHRMLNFESGLLGLSGQSSDMRSVVEASDAGDARASLAVRVFVHRARQAIGALAVTLGRVDALVFTGGIGEHSARIRDLICNGLGVLGLELDQSVNLHAHPDTLVSCPASRARILVITAREDLMMLRAALTCLHRRGGAEMH